MLGEFNEKIRIDNITGNGSYSVSGAYSGQDLVQRWELDHLVQNWARGDLQSKRNADFLREQLILWDLKELNETHSR